MKTLIKFPAMMLGLLLGIAGTTESAKAQYDDVSLQTFTMSYRHTELGSTTQSMVMYGAPM